MNPRTERAAIYAVIFIIALFFSACSLTYVPSTAHIPLHENKKEFIGNVTFGNSGLGMQSSYSFANSIAVAATGNFLGDDQLTHYSYDLGIGYFEMYENGVIFETFVGGGYGFTERIGDMAHNVEATNGEYYSAFLQPSLGFKPGNWELGIGLKTSYIRYESFLTPPSHNYKRIFFEPVLSLKYGWESFRFTLQIGSSSPLGNLPVSIDYYPAFLSIGLQYKFSK